MRIKQLSNATDAAGNSETTQLLTFAVDTTLIPQLSITSIGGDDSIVSGKSGDNQIVGVGEAGAKVELFAVTGTDEILLLGEVTADADGNFVYELTAENLSSLGEGENKAIRATQTDAAGNSETTQLLTFAVDTKLSPQLSITSVGGDDSIVSGKSGDNQIVGLKLEQR